MHPDASPPDSATSGELIRGWLAAAEIAGRSATTLRRLVDRGELDALKTADGVYEFQREHLEALRPGEHDAALVAAVFADLDAAKPLTQIVCQRKMSVETMRGLYEEWRALREMDLHVEGADKALAKLHAQLETLQLELEQLKTQAGLGALADGYSCASCHAGGSVAVRVLCTSCQRQEWLGFWPD